MLNCSALSKLEWTELYTTMMTNLTISTSSYTTRKNQESFVERRAFVFRFLYTHEKQRETHLHDPSWKLNFGDTSYFCRFFITRLWTALPHLLACMLDHAGMCSYQEPLRFHSETSQWDNANVWQKVYCPLVFTDGRPMTGPFELRDSNRSKHVNDIIAAVV